MQLLKNFFCDKCEDYGFLFTTDVDTKPCPYCAIEDDEFNDDTYYAR